MSVRSRVAFASGAAGAVGTAMVISGRLDGSVALAVLLAFSIRTASLATLVDAGPILAGGAVRGLRARAWLAPAWVLVAAAAVARAGSTTLADVRGANAVAGLAVAHGPILTVAGSLLALAASILALVTWRPLGVETGGGPGAIGRVEVPEPVRRLDALGVLGEAALALALFVGPQVTGADDAAWWGVGIAALVGCAWYARRAPLPHRVASPALPLGLAALGLALVLVGGPP